jgi:hypothetical protein
MAQMKKILDKGGTPVFTTYAVEIGDSLWSAVYDYVRKQWPDPNDDWCSLYRVDGIFEENNQKFAVLQERSSLKYYRLDFSVDESNGFVPATELVEVTATYVPAEEPQFSEEAVAAYVDARRAEETPAEDPEPEEDPAPAEDPEPAPVSDPEPASTEDPEPESEEQPVSYNLNDIPEYIELQSQFANA